MGQILLACDLPEETVTNIIMLYKNKKEMVRSLDRDIDFFDTVTGVLQEDTLAPFIFIIYLDDTL